METGLAKSSLLALVVDFQHHILVVLLLCFLLLVSVSFLLRIESIMVTLVRRFQCIKSHDIIRCLGINLTVRG